MEADQKKIEVEIPMTLPKREGDAGLCAVGTTGDTDYASMKAREKLIAGMQEREEYRYAVTCDRCGECMEFRGFSPRGAEIVLGLWCRLGEFETTAFHTCNKARLPRKERKKVVYDLRNAPIGFREGLSSLQLSAPMEEHREDVKPDRPDKTVYAMGYKGGSEHYNRIDGDKEAEGTGKIPRRLMN